MGTQLFDQYTLLHYAVGVIVYFWGVSASVWFFAHVSFEVLENTEQGMKFINALKVWPGGKPRADAFINIVGDSLSAMLGWYCAKMLDDFGKERGWY